MELLWRIFMWVALSIVSLISILANFRKDGTHNPLDPRNLTQFGKIMFLTTVILFGLALWFQVSDHVGSERRITTLNNQHEKDSIQWANDIYDLKNQLAAQDSSIIDLNGRINEKEESNQK